MGQSIRSLSLFSKSDWLCEGVCRNGGLSRHARLFAARLNGWPRICRLCGLSFCTFIIRGCCRVSARITVQSGLNDPGRAQVLVEDDRGAFLFDCGAPSWNDALPRLDGALISHAHPRHTAGIPYLPQDTPICASVMTSAILKATQDISQSARENETVFAVPGGYDGPVASRQAVQRPYTFLTDTERFR